jgi:hypothetical protein
MLDCWQAPGSLISMIGFPPGTSHRLEHGLVMLPAVQNSHRVVDPGLLHQFPGRLGPRGEKFAKLNHYTPLQQQSMTAIYYAPATTEEA